MSLHLVRTTDERPACPEAVRLLRAALREDGRAALLVPSFAQALDAQRLLAAAGVSLGVTVTTLAAWAEERWGVWGDGRRLVDDASRDVVAGRVLARAAAAPDAGVSGAPGVASLLADLARRGLPWLAGAGRPEGVSDAEAAVVGLLEPYEDELAAHGLVEPCRAMALLPAALDAAGARVAPVVCAGFSELSRAERELVCGLAARHEVALVVPAGEAPAQACARELARQVLDLARERGVSVVREGEDGAAGPVPGLPPRAPELDALLGALFCPSAPVEPTGAVRVLLPAGPSARPELVCREVRSLADAGAREVVLAAPDPRAAWSELSGRLLARGVAVRAQLSVRVEELESGRAYLSFARGVARLAELAQGWPAAEEVPGAPRAGTVRVRLADMSWWPPRDLSDFLLSDISHVDAPRARALDAAWRANRLLTPAAVLEQLQSERDVSPEVAAATRELLRGRLGSAASKLLAPYVQGEGRTSPLAADATAALSAVLGVARSLKELGVTADPQAADRVSLQELVGLASEALSRARAALRLELAPDGAVCTARIMSPGAAARLAPRSTDALVLLGQSSSESAVGAPDDVCSALLLAYGVEPAPRAMDAARARFAALAGAPRSVLALERPLFGADGKQCYPSVMLTELMACYGLEADADAEDLASALGPHSVPSRAETPVRENASRSGVAAALQLSEEVAPAGRLEAEERACVSPPPEGISVEDARPLLSASQIETYLECPYKWFSLRRLRLRDADAAFGGAEMGTFAHRVLEVTRRELLARAQERSLGGRALADARGERADAMQQAPYREMVAELEARAQLDPAARVPGSSVADPVALEEARTVLAEEFDAHLLHQYQLERGRRPLPQALVPHSAQQQGQLLGLRRDLLGLLDFESTMLDGFEPRFFEWGFGRGGARVEYAGVLLTGTIDRIDVDAHGQAVVIDYKHKSDAGFAGEYDVFGADGAPEGPLALPRRVQSLIYGQVVRRAFPQLDVRAAVYLCTKGSHALAGAVDEELVENVFGERAPSARRLPRLSVPRAASFGERGEGGMGALLDACEELVAARIERMLAGDIEAAPVDADACSFCPVLNCERRLRK
ncbi:PD-(D/E)XK nuclease family protein [Thermophilibacter mediterraneus]|uniref:PD-(D/E)XK nuclease family protein n=1 Tax=Thermophilibacter mediterraneus TaxID=1871031 RepID=UPI0032081DEC